jgi:dipeptidyl aminopeptidase/acylaminoacyl peptidase
VPNGCESREQVQERNAVILSCFRLLSYRRATKHFIKRELCVLSVISASVLTFPQANHGDATNRPTNDQLPVETVLSARSFAREAPSLSPDGHWLAYTVCEPVKITDAIGGYDLFEKSGAPKWLKGADVWITNITNGASTNLTGGEGTNWDPVWSPDGRYVAFYSNRSGTANLWIYDVARSSLRRVSDATVAALEEDQVVRWTADSKQILTKISRQVHLAEDPSKLKSEQQRSETNPPSTVLVYRSSVNIGSPGLASVGGSDSQADFFTQAERADLALIDLATGLATRVVKDISPMWYELSPDNRYIAFASLKGLVDGNVMRSAFHLAIMDRVSGSTIVSFDFDQSPYKIYAAWSPDGKWLSVVRNGVRKTDHVVEVYLLSVNERTSHDITPTVSHGTWSFWTTAPFWSPDSAELYLLAYDSTLQQGTDLWRVAVLSGEAMKIGPIPGHRIDAIVARQATPVPLLIGPPNKLVLATLDVESKRCGFYAVDLSTKTFVKLLEEDKQYGPDQALSTFTSADGQNIIYMAQDVGHPPDFWSVNNRFTAPTRITHLNMAFDGYRLGKSKLIEWHSLDGETLRAALLLPADYQEGKKYPLIVWIYGGLNASDYLNYFGLWPWDSLDNMQLFSSRGYAVLFADSRTAAGMPMASLAKSVLPGVDKAIELGIADADRVGVMGESFGGYSTLSLIVQTTRFKAAVSRYGPGDLVGLYGEMDESGETFGTGLLENGQFQILGTPWQFRDRYVENSPVFYLDRVQTPLLIVQGSKDTAVAPFLADEIFVGLRRLQKEVVYAKYEGEGHGLSSYANRVDALSREVEWFDRYLMDKRSDASN